MGYHKSRKGTEPSPWELTRKIGSFAIVFISTIWFIIVPSFEPLLAIVGGILAVLIYFRFRKSKYQAIADSLFAVFIVVGLILISIVLIVKQNKAGQLQVGGAATTSTKPTPIGAQEGEFLVLVADFEGPEPEKNRVTEILADNLNQKLGQFQNIKVRRLNRVITDAEGSDVAKLEGKRYNAGIVIWGWYGVTSTSVPVGLHLEFLGYSTIGSEACSGSLGVVRTLPRASLEDVTLQMDLSNELTTTITLLLGWIHLSAGNYDQASDYLQASLNHLPDYVSITGNKEKETLFDKNVIYFALASSRYADSKVDYLPLYYNQVIALDPNNPLGYYFRGDAYFRLDNFSNAISDYSKVIKLSPEDAVAYYDRGRAYEAQGLWASAQNDYTIALALNSDALIEYLTKHRIAEDGYEDIRLVINDYSNKISANPDIVIYYYVRGIAYATSLNYETAILDYNRIIELDKRASSAYRLKGEAYALQGKFDLAIAEYDKAIDLNEKVPCYFVDRGGAYAGKKAIDLAKFDYSRAIEIAPRFYIPYLERAKLSLQQDDWDGSTLDIERAIEIIPNSPDPYKLRHNYLMNTSEDKRNAILSDRTKVDVLISDLSKLIMLEPKNAPLYYSLRGALYQSLGNNDAAREDYEKVIELDPGFAQEFNIREYKAQATRSSIGWFLIILAYMVIIVSIYIDISNQKRT